jgi:hypothetical protein
LHLAEEPFGVAALHESEPARDHVVVQVLWVHADQGALVVVRRDVAFGDQRAPVVVRHGEVLPVLCEPVVDLRDALADDRWPQGPVELVGRCRIGVPFPAGSGDVMGDAGSVCFPVQVAAMARWWRQSAAGLVRGVQKLLCSLSPVAGYLPVLQLELPALQVLMVWQVQWCLPALQTTGWSTW